MEFLIYMIIYFSAIFFCFKNTFLNKRLFFVFWFLIGMWLSITIRLETDYFTQSDFSSLTRLMMTESQNLLLYFYREFIFIFSIQYLYKLTENPAYVFIICDSIFYIAFFKSITLVIKGLFPNHNTHKSYYIYFSFLLFFPIVLGFHNMYRQMLANVFAMLSFGYLLNNKNFKSIISFVVSFFIHNSAVFFLPILFFLRKGFKSKVLSLILTLVIVFLNLTIAEATNEFLSRALLKNEEGYKITLMYIIGLVFIFLFTFLTERYFRRRVKIKLSKLVFFILIIYLSSTIGFSSGVSQRVAFWAYFLVYPIILVYAVDFFKQKLFLKFMFINITVLPLIFIHNSTIRLPF